jgi:hypothetical protein
MMLRRPRKNAALKKVLKKWLVAFAVLLIMNSIFIISTTTGYASVDVDVDKNNVPEFDAEDTSVNMSGATTASSALEPISIEANVTQEVLLEKAKTSNNKEEEVVSGGGAKNNAENVEVETLTNSVISTSNSTDFTRYDDVVIVTKVLFSKDLKNLKHCLCYLSHAYNDKRKYDIVVFTTLPWTEAEIAELRAVVAPANLIVALEAPPLEEQFAMMSPEEKQFHYKRCNVNVTAGEEIGWFHYCTEPGSNHYNNLAYSWQAEFRSYHIWTHPAIMKVSLFSYIFRFLQYCISLSSNFISLMTSLLKLLRMNCLKYKYMIWLDSDARVAASWDGNNDPMKVMVENNLNLMFSGLEGKTKSLKVKEKIDKVYGKSICRLQRTAGGTLNPHFCNDNKTAFILNQVAGNHHISNLKTYRKPIHQKFLKEFVGDYRFGRQFDDQIAITIPAVMEGGEKAWHERSHGLKLMIAHHRMYDNVFQEKAPQNLDFFYKKLKENFEGLEDRCKRFIK